VQLIRSLFCLRGIETGFRFFTIQLCCYLSLLVSDLLVEQFIAYSLISIMLMCLVAPSTVRFARFLQSQKILVIAPIASFLITSIMLFAMDNSLQLLALLLPIVSGGLIKLTATNSNKAQDFLMGYSGPVDMSDFAPRVHTAHQRVEPVLHGNHEETAIDVANERGFGAKQQSANNRASNNSSWSDLQSNLPKALTNPAVIAAALMVPVAITIYMMMNFGNQEETMVEETANKQLQVKEPELLFHLDMPDEFILHLDENQGVVIEWQATAEEVSTLWDLATARGNKQCNTIEFNRDDSIRSMKVLVEHARYRAYFSPLDNRELLNLMAKRGNFQICGFKFSLKGSMAALGQAPKFNDYIDY